MTPYYQDAWATIYHGDCREIIGELPIAEMVLIDPPYGTQDLAGGYGRRQNWDKGDGLGRVIANDSDLAVLADAFPLLLAKVECGWIMAFYAARKTPEFCKVTEGGEWFGEIIWDKGAPGLGYHVRYAHENIAIFKQGSPKRPERALLSVIRAQGLASLHPHEKPFGVLCPMVEWGCPEGGLVIDAFMGSGTTLRAAKSTGRKSIGIDVDESHCETAALRLAQEVLAL